MTLNSNAECLIRSALNRLEKLAVVSSKRTTAALKRVFKSSVRMVLGHLQGGQSSVDFSVLTVVLIAGALMVGAVPITAYVFAGTTGGFTGFTTSCPLNATGNTSFCTFIQNIDNLLLYIGGAVMAIGIVYTGIRMTLKRFLTLKR